MDRQQAAAKIREILATHFVKEINTSNISDAHGLIDSGLLDSINVLRLVDKLETEFGIEFKAHEVDKDNLNSINHMLNFIEKKKQG